MPERDWFDLELDPNDSLGMATPQAGYYGTQAPSDGAPQYSPAQQQVLDAYRRAGHTPPDQTALDEWANAIAAGRASPGQLEASLSTAMRQPGAQAYNYGPQGGSQLWDEAWFRQNIGAPTTPQELLALEQKITAAGGKVLRNAAGTAGKVQAPNGQIIDVILAAGEGGRGFQWLTDAGGGAGGAASGSLVAPWTKEFAYPGFVAPTAEEAAKDPGYQFALKEGEQALQRSAAARGTLLTGGTLKDLMSFGEQAATQNYGNVYGRRFNEWATGYNQAREQYGLGRENFFLNQDRPFDKYTTLANLGYGAAANLGGQGANYSSLYGNTVLGGAGAQGDYWTQGAAARAAGRVGGANAYNAAFGNLANMGMDAAMLYYLQGRR